MIASELSQIILQKKKIYSKTWDNSFNGTLLFFFPPASSKYF